MIPMKLVWGATLEKHKGVFILGLGIFIDSIRDMGKFRLLECNLTINLGLWSIQIGRVLKEVKEDGESTTDEDTSL